MMTVDMPEELKEAIERELATVSLRGIAEARRTLSDKYRSGDLGRLIKGQEERLSYIAARMPATFAACSRVFLELGRFPCSDPISSLLDLGSGPGTAAWAMSELYPSVQTYTLIEQDPELIVIGKRLATASKSSGLQGAQWVQARIDSSFAIPEADVIVCSYSAGEYPPGFAIPLFLRCWEKCTHSLIVIEPGTPRGFQLISALRRALLEAGASLIAPCPHVNPCPLEMTERWCHFSVRMGRTSIHSYLKQGSRGFEDEKFSYLIFSKKSVRTEYERLLSMPKKRSGHLSLHLCTSEGEAMKTISKKTPEAYKQARKLHWGDCVEA